jgi:hypothetical protein
MLWDKRGKWREWEGGAGQHPHTTLHDAQQGSGKRKRTQRLQLLGAPLYNHPQHPHLRAWVFAGTSESGSGVLAYVSAFFHVPQQQPPSQTPSKTLCPKSPTPALQILCVGTWGAPRPPRLLGPRRKRHSNGSGMRQGLDQDIASTIGSRQLTRATMRDAKARVPS